MIIRSDKFQKLASSASAFYGADTERAEFEGLLTGLQGILDIMEWNTTQARALMSAKRCTVFWVSDRENLVGSVSRKPDGTPVFRRKSTPDLWARFEWYEALFDIAACWRPRNTIAWQKIADGVASECRTMMKHYVEISRNENRLF